MRTYKRTHATAEKKRTRVSRKGKSIIAVCASVAVVAVALTLSLTFGLRKNVPTDNKVPVDVKPVITFTAPLNECTVTKQASLDKLVYNDTLKQWRTHNGVDFEAAAGSDVLSIADGTVKSVENTILEGTVVTVEHADGYVSIYKGLDTASVANGEKIESGAKIGTVGTMMCEKNMGAHLHLEMKKDGKYVAVTDYIDVENNK